MKEIKTSIVYTQLTNGEDKFITLLQGGSRSGKTYNSLIYMILHALQNKGVLISVVRFRLTSLKATALRDFIEICLYMGIKLQQNKSENIYTLPNGSKFEFFGVDDAQKVRGRKRDILFLNEANEIDFETFSQLQMRTTQRIIIDFNPSFGSKHWLNDLINDDNNILFKTTFTDNPFLEDNIRNTLLSYQKTNPILWQIYGQGNFARAEGQIYTNYTIISDDTLPDDPELIKVVGIDFGFTNDPTAIVDIRIKRNTKQIWVKELAYEKGLLNSDIIKILKNNNINHQIVCDAAEPKSIAEITRAGFSVRKSNKNAPSNDKKVWQINWLQEWQQNILKDSKNYISEINNYCWDKDKNGMRINIPSPIDDHAMDAARYACYTIVGSQVEFRV